MEHRILAKTVKTASCWFYTGSKASGYGTIIIDGKPKVVHRLMYEAVVGEIPAELELDHLCRIRHCVNPDHLQPVTHLENTRRGPQSKEQNTDAYLHPSRKKTHLLYIHDDLFRQEKRKSRLVNNLLERHYHGTVGGKTQDEILVDIKVAQEVMNATANLRVDAMKYDIQRNARQTTREERAAGMGDSFELPPTKLCKIHGVPLTDMGKCLQKGCKYA